MNDTGLRIGIDWSGGCRRTFLLNADGELLRKQIEEVPAPVTRPGLEGSLQSLLHTFGISSADVLLSGEASAGWTGVEALPGSFPLRDLPRALGEIPLDLAGVRCRAVPGYRFTDSNGMPDVMQGEETRVFGALQLKLPDGWFLLPGARSSWVKLEQGRIIDYLSFMSGELYALLVRHGTPGALSSTDESAPEAFAAGLQAARHGYATRAACCCRALVATGALPAAHSTSWLSGVLIGAELYDMLRRTPHEMPLPVQVIGSGVLTRRYLAALELLGIEARVWQPDGVHVAALRALFSGRA